MHEASLVQSIFDTLEAEFTAAELQRMTLIELQVGELSNVEPVLMQSAFEALTTVENKYRSVTLEIEMVPVKVYCAACDHYSRIQQYKFVCESCGIPNNNLVQGTELLIHRVHFEEEVEI